MAVPLFLSRFAWRRVLITGKKEFIVSNLALASVRFVAKLAVVDANANERKIARVLGWKFWANLRAALTKILSCYRKELPHYL